MTLPAPSRQCESNSSRRGKGTDGAANPVLHDVGWRPAGLFPHRQRPTSRAHAALVRAPRTRPRQPGHAPHDARARASSHAATVRRTRHWPVAARWHRHRIRPLVQDLETVVDAAEFDRFILFGLSQGAAQAIAYAARHPERVASHSLWRLCTRHASSRQPGEAKGDASSSRAGWCARVGAATKNRTGSSSRRSSSRTAPSMTHHSLNEMQRVATTPEIAAQFMLTRRQRRCQDLLPQVKVPTLVVHAFGDRGCPVRSARKSLPEYQARNLCPWTAATI